MIVLFYDDDDSSDCNLQKTSMFFLFVCTVHPVVILD